MHRINTFQPVGRIVAELRQMTPHDASVALGRSAALAIYEENAEALLMLALAHCVWRNAPLDAPAMAEMVEVMRSQGMRMAPRKGP